MHKRLMAALAALVVAFGLGLAPAAQAHATGQQIIDWEGKLQPSARGGVAVDDLRDRALGKLAKGEKFIAPPIKAAGGASAKLLTGPYYHYNLGQDFTNSNPSGVPQGVAFNATIHARSVDTADGGIHSITQIAWREVTGPNPATDEQIVEWGYEINPGVFGDSLPRLFASIWKDNTWCGSHTGGGSCGGWVDNASNSINLGGSINGAVGNSRTFEIWYDSSISGGGGFRLYYNTNEVGYFQKSVVGWDSNFDQARTVQIFGEVATNQDPMSTDCTDMGDGVNPGDDSPAAGAQIGSVTYRDGSRTLLPTSEVDMAVSQFSSPGTYPGATAYNIASQSTRTFRYGGPGVC